MYWTYIGKVLAVGVCRGSLCEKSPEVAPCQISASSSRFQTGPTASQSWAYEWCQLHLWESRFNKRKTLLCLSSWESGVREKKPCRPQGECRSRAEGAPGTEQLSPCSLWFPPESRSPRCSTWRSPLRTRPQAGAAANGQGPRWSKKSGGAATLNYCPWNLVNLYCPQSLLARISTNLLRIYILYITLCVLNVVPLNFIV